MNFIKINFVNYKKKLLLIKYNLTKKNMSNRLIWVLIILSFIIWWFFYWSFVYVPNKIEKEKQIELSLENEKKEIKLTKVDDIIIETKTLTPEEKIEELKLTKSFYKVINLENNNFYFSKVDNSLDLKINNKLVWNFDLVPDNKLEIQRIYSSDNDFYLVVWNKKYIYNSLSDIILELDLNIDVNYIKRSDDVYIINTKKWSFIYNKANSNLEYFIFFEDFVYYNDSYIWIIRKDDITRINNLSLGLLDKNSIFLYNPKTKEKKSLYMSDLDLEKIYMQAGEIYFVDSSSLVYKLENLEQ